jgi:hypothetical protein
MIPKLVVKFIIKRVIKAIQKADDKVIASNHEKRIKELEKNSHTPKEFVCMECGCKAKKKESK